MVNGPCDVDGVQRIAEILIARAALYVLGHPPDRWPEWRFVAEAELLPFIDPTSLLVDTDKETLPKFDFHYSAVSLCTRMVIAVKLALIPLALIEAERDPSTRLGKLGGHFECRVDEFYLCIMPTHFIVSDFVLDKAWEKFQATRYGLRKEDVGAASLLAGVGVAPPEMRWIREDGTKAISLRNAADWWQVVNLAGVVRFNSLADVLKTFLHGTADSFFVDLASARCQRISMGLVSFSCQPERWGPRGHPGSPSSDVWQPDGDWESSRGQMPNVASCISGPAGRLNVAALDTFATNVLRVLRADGFAYLGLPLSLSEDAKPMIATVLGSLFTAIEVAAGQMEEIFVQSDPPPLWILEAMLTGHSKEEELGESNASAEDVSYDLLRIHDTLKAHVSGVWGGPLFGQRGGALYQYYERHVCVEMIEAAESRRGQTYVWVTLSRLDLHWLRPHWRVPMDLVSTNFSCSSKPASFKSQPRLICWVPSGEENGGINDRHAVLPRVAAKVYIELWTALLSGKAFPWSPPFYWNPEMLMEQHLELAGVEVCRLPPVAAVACCPRGQQCDRAQGARAHLSSDQTSTCFANDEEFFAATTSIIDSTIIAEQSLM